MKTEIKNGNIIITLPIEAAKISASGKMSLVASSGGWQDLECKDQGHDLRGNITIGYYNERR